MPLSSYVSTASGQKMPVAEGTRLVFGRGPGVDLIIAAGRGLSRRAGLVTAMAAGVWIANISRFPSATSIFWPDAVLTYELSGIVRSRRSGTTSI